MYEKKLETLDDLVDSDVIYGHHSLADLFDGFIPYPELATFLQHKRLKEDSNDLRKCVERMITKRDFACFVAPFYGTYVARDLGTVDVGKIICPFDENLLSGDLIVLLKKGNLLLDGLNILMRRYLEAGLLEGLWTELQHRASLRGRGRFEEAAGDMFFTFSVYHLMPAFVVLIVGNVLSSVVFIGELIVNCIAKVGGGKYSRIRRSRNLKYYQRIRRAKRFNYYQRIRRERMLKYYHCIRRARMFY
jgi:hypothetical protein